MPTTYRKFIISIYDADYRLQETMSKKGFIQHYIDGFGFSEWLETLRNHTASYALVRSIAKTFFVHGNTSPDSMPMVLSSISRNYNLELPAVYGILSPGFWSDVAEKSAWRGLVTKQDCASRQMTLPTRRLTTLPHLPPLGYILGIQCIKHSITKLK